LREYEEKAGNAEVGRRVVVSGGEKSTTNDDKNSTATSREEKKDDRKTNGKSEKDFYNLRKDVDRGIKDIMELLSKKQVADTDNPRSSDSLSYQPVAGFAVEKNLSDLSFPDNIIQFIKKIVEWVKNLILFAIKGIRNIVKSLFGGPNDNEKEELLDLKKKLKLDFKKSQVYKVMGTPVILDKNRATGAQRNIVVSAREMDHNEIKKLDLLGESALNEFTITLGRGKDSRGNSDGKISTTSKGSDDRRY
jgi:hypothetical protein